MHGDKILQKITLYNVAVMLLLICLAVALKMRPEPQNTKEEPEDVLDVMEAVIPEEQMVYEPWDEYGHAQMGEAWAVWNVLLSEEREKLREYLEKPCVIIRRTGGAEEKITYTEDLLRHSMTIFFDGGEKPISVVDILRVSGGEYYVGLPELQVRKTIALAEEEKQEGNISEPVEEFVSGDLMEEVNISYSQEKEGNVSVMDIVWNGYFFPELVETPEYYVITLKKAKDIYKKIVVLDAGHGGKDPGAGVENYKVKESDITLSIILYVKELLDADDEIAAFYTRTGNTYPSLPERVELALGLDADLFVSVHCNSTAKTASNGTSVLYNAKQGVEDAFNSKHFAKICLDNVSKALGTKAGYIIDRQDLHIVRRATMPVVLIETAYLSNPSDLKILKDKEKQKEAAEAIYQSILSAFEAMGR